MSGWSAKEPRDAIQQSLAVMIPVIDALRTDQQTGIALEMSIGCKGHPMVFQEVDGDRHQFSPPALSHLVALLLFPLVGIEVRRALRWPSRAKATGKSSLWSKQRECPVPLAGLGALRVGVPISVSGDRTPTELRGTPYQSRRQSAASSGSWLRLKREPVSSGEPPLSKAGTAPNRCTSDRGPTLLAGGRGDLECYSGVVGS